MNYNYHNNIISVSSFNFQTIPNVFVSQTQGNQSYLLDEKIKTLSFEAIKEINEIQNKIENFKEIRTKLKLPLMSKSEIDREELEEYSNLEKKFNELSLQPAVALVLEQKKILLNQFIKSLDKTLFEEYYSFIYDQLIELSLVQNIDSLVYAFALKIDDFELKNKFCDFYPLLDLTKCSEHRSLLVYLICSKMTQLYRSSGTQNTAFIPQIAKVASTIQDHRLKKIFVEMLQEFFI